MKSVLTIIGKLSERVINGELLKYLAKTSNDEQPGIRTNTTICLGKMSKNLSVGTRSKVLIAAFSRSLRDPFVHARNAALMALAVTSDAFNEDDCANRILPALCPCLIDKEKLIRDQTNKTMDIYLQRLRKFASSMPASVLPPPSTQEAAGAAAPRMGTPQPSDSASWTGWAISSFTNKVSAATGDIQSGANGTNPAEARPSSVPPTNDHLRPTPLTSSASTLHRQAVTSPPASSARTSMSSIPNDLFQDPALADIDDGDAWGDMDEDNFFDAPSEAIPSTSKSTSAANPFGDTEEPDFAGWLAAQSGKKPGAKALPKGLVKPAAGASNGRPALAGRTASLGASGVGAKKAATVVVKPAAKPLVTKKISTAPKAMEDNDDDADAWGDGW